MKIKKTILALIIIVAALLRFYQLGQNPPSLYWDEVSLGYNAYSILKTGHDEHGQFLPLDRFVAFGDYKPPGYIYASVPFIALFGLNAFGVRFLSALAGSLTVLLTYFLVKELFSNSKFKTDVTELLALLSSFLLAISPWHIHMSRGAFEANLAMFFNTLALLFFFKGLKKGKFLICSSLSFMMAFYTFNSNRIISLLLVGVLAGLFWKKIWKRKKPAIVAIILAILLTIPSIKFLTSAEGGLRFKEVSIFNNLMPLKTSNQQIDWLGNTIWARLLFNRRLAYGWHFLSHFFDHFNPRYLFILGDRNPRFSTGDTGIFYVFEMPLLLAGLYQIFKNKDKKLWFLLIWWLAAMIPSSLAKETPHMLRTLSVVPAPQIISALGTQYLYNVFRKKKTVLLGFSLLVVFNLVYFFHSYWVHWPVEAASEWQYGYKQAILKAEILKPSYDQIIISDFYGRPYINVLFYTKYPPEKYWQTRQAKRDSFLLWHVNSFDKYLFGLDKLKQVEGKTLVLAEVDEAPEGCLDIDTINLPSGQPIIKLCEMNL